MGIPANFIGRIRGHCMHSHDRLEEFPPKFRPWQLFIGVVFWVIIGTIGYIIWDAGIVARIIAAIIVGIVLVWYTLWRLLVWLNDRLQ